MSMSPLDDARLREALALAERGFGLTDPNPRVGCVLGHEDGTLLGQGSTQAVGGAHAEVMALRDAAAAGNSVRGATAWVSLEPCAHHGRTPPCCDALIEAGLARVVVAIEDPFPQVAGAGIARLRASGVRVDMAAPELRAQAHDINIGFFSRVQRGRPWVRMKIAASLDGRTALPNGVSQWITGSEARADGHAWRRRAGAVLTGIGTVLADNPRLDVRHVPTSAQPWRVVLDSQLRLPPTARLLAPPGKTLVVAVDPEPGKQALLQAAGAEVLRLLGDGARVDLAALLSLLGERGVNELHVEAGATLNGGLLSAGLVDELLVYLAPSLLGMGRELAALGPFEQLSEAMHFRFIDAQLLGIDMRLRLRRPEPASSAL
jgi:diaminohydroxyphosphoribosylaminopyrimidine deaminase/5-amino-6-(5-phosphoribosylamino)uracil reductase